MRRKTTAALLAALCLILLLPGCSRRAAKDRPAVTPLSCTAPTALCDKDITLSDSMSADAELAGISAMLDSMSRAFALYPQGFLAQFRNSVGEGGLCFLLVAHIASDYGVVGCAYDSADWQYIALDVQADYMREGTVCHEIWHATENEIRSRDYTAFDWDQWNRLNPEGFLYYGDGTMQDPPQP